MGDVARQAYFALLRWRVDATRDESRNVAVLLADAEGELRGLRAAPLSAISARLRDQGILDEFLAGLESRLEPENLFTSQDLFELHETFQRSLVVTEPQPVAVTELDDALTALYRAFLAPHGGRSRGLTKGAVLDRVMDTFRRQGLRARRGAYIDDFIFDAVLEVGSEPTPVEVASFAAERKDWTPLERETGHFLYAIGQLGLPGRAVIQPPEDGNGAETAYDRVRRWLDREGVPVATVDEVTQGQLQFDAEALK